MILQINFININRNRSILSFVLFLMDNSCELCSRCLKLKNISDFSKAQRKKKGPKICLECSKNTLNKEKQEKKEEIVPSVSIPHNLFKPLFGDEGDKADKMICLTMHQPWASLLVYGIKRAEGRGWNTDFRGRLWIHAGKIGRVYLNNSCQRTIS